MVKIGLGMLLAMAAYDSSNSKQVRENAATQRQKLNAFLDQLLAHPEEQKNWYLSRLAREFYLSVTTVFKEVAQFKATHDREAKLSLANGRTTKSSETLRRYLSRFN